MPIAERRISKTRVNFEGSLSKRDIQSLVSDRDLKTLQCSRPVELKTWELLNDEFFSIRSDVELRVYGFYALTCDLRFTLKMTNVRHFSAGPIRDMAGVRYLAAMEKLESLGIGNYHLEGFEFLNHISKRLKKLSLGATKSKKPDLSPLNSRGVSTPTCGSA